MDAERRQVTVLFTDMVGFTAFSERAGEEAAFTLMQTIARLMADQHAVESGQRALRHFEAEQVEQRAQVPGRVEAECGQSHLQFFARSLSLLRRR